MRPLHFSTLKTMSLSPAHAKFRHESGDGEETASTRIGTAAHSIALGTGRQVLNFEGVRRGKAWEEFKSQSGDAVILNAREYALAAGIGLSLRDHSEAIRYLDGVREMPMSWEWLGRKCATRGVDVIGRSDRIGISFVTELKTTKCAKPEWFRNEVLRRQYAAQLCWYEQALGVRVPELVIVAVESVPPHPVVVFRLTERLRELGKRQIRLWMEHWLTCEQSDEWPGYAQSVLELDAPDDFEMDFSGVDELEEASGF